jgi:hypothetical protein
MIPDFERVYACKRFDVNLNTTIVPANTGNPLVTATTMVAGNHFFVLIRICLTTFLLRQLLDF